MEVETDDSKLLLGLELVLPSCMVAQEGFEGVLIPTARKGLLEHRGIHPNIQEGSQEVLCGFSWRWEDSILLQMEPVFEDHYGTYQIGLHSNISSPYMMIQELADRGTTVKWPIDQEKSSGPTMDPWRAPETTLLGDKMHQVLVSRIVTWEIDIKNNPNKEVNDLILALYDNKNPRIYMYIYT